MVEMHLGSGIHWQEADERPEQREQSQILKEFLDGEQFVPVETESRGRVLSWVVMVIGTLPGFRSIKNLENSSPDYSWLPWGVQVHFAELSPVCDQAVQNEVSRQSSLL